MKINKNKNENKYYKTADLALIAALSLNFPIESLEKSAGKKVYFYFEKTLELERFIDSYWRADLKIEPQTYFNQLKIIKTRIYSEI